MTREKKKLLKNEKGFTLIEIIAVIIIMGILAAVAVPKFFSMQEDAKRAAVNGALAEAAARFNHAFARYILTNKSAPTAVTGVLDTDDYLGTGASGAGGADIGDFNVQWLENGTDELVITVISADTIGATALAAMAATDKVKTITGVNWGS
jgi:MSHA pilin protein MshA